MKSNLISKRETSRVIDIIVKQWTIDIPKIKNFNVYHISNKEQIIVSNELKILKIDDNYVPFLSDTEILKKFPAVTIDMGAIKFMCKGANLMRPGIIKFDEFERDMLVCITEETHGKFLAVGRSLISSSELDSIERGEILRNLHYISDKYWEIGKTLRLG